MDTSHIADRLERRFQLGSRPTLRRALYQRLQALVDEKGERAYLVIATVADDATGKDDPGKYFAWVVIRRLQERGILSAPEL